MGREAVVCGTGFNFPVDLTPRLFFLDNEAVNALAHASPVPFLAALPGTEGLGTLGTRPLEGGSLV